MPVAVRLSITTGPLKGKEYTFTERTTRIAGRAEDCDPQIPEGISQSMQVSRHHCLFDINPPHVRVRDLGSLNGTFVNDAQIGRRHPGQTPEQVSQVDVRERDLKDGDKVRLGETVIVVSVVVPARCAQCGNELGGGPAGGDGLCDSCRAHQHGHHSTYSHCSVCGTKLPAEVRFGVDMCASCRQDVPSRVHDLLRKADDGASNLLAIRGYQTVRELGRGGQGVVYLARHEETGEEVALKVLLAQVAVDPQAVYGFQREVNNVSALRHPNVVRFRHSGVDGGMFYFTSEYCDGGNVVNLMRKRGGPLAVEEAVIVAVQILNGLAYAHTAPIPVTTPAAGPQDTRLQMLGRSSPMTVVHGLVHRDVKPANILLSGSGSTQVAKLADFGLAKAFDLAGMSGHTMTGSVAGTLSFMPRAQVINFRFARPEVDVWSCAASLYFMLTGSAPRTFPRDMDGIRVVLGNRATPIRERDSTIPARLAEVIDEALIDKPRIKIASADQLARALMAAL